MVRRKEELVAAVNTAMKGGPGKVVFQHLADKAELLEHARLFSVATLEPGCGIGYHVHENETEYFYVLSGTPTLNDDGEEVLLRPGDFAMTPSGHGHSITNKTEETVQVLALIMLQ